MEIHIKSTSKNLGSKCNQKPFDHAKQSAADALKTASKSAIQKTAEATGDFIDNTIADEITEVSRISPQNSSGTVTNEAENIRLDREIPKERYIFLEKRQKIIDNLRLI